MNIITVRHGETEENVRRITQGQLPGKLTQNGIEQAKALAAELKDEHYDAIFSSDLARCVDTATLIAEYHPELEVRLTPALREYSFGEQEGKPSLSPDVWDDFPGAGLEKKAPGGENAIEVSKRVAKFVNTLLRENPQGSYLIVTHGGPMRILRSLAEDITLSETFEANLGNCSVWRFAINDYLPDTVKRW